MKYAISTAIVAVTFFAQPTFAGDTPYTKQYAICMDGAGGVTASMQECLMAETKIHDTRLNAAYKKLGEQLIPTRKKELRTAQRLWIQYRDANCSFYADPEGGTMAVLNASDCLLRETASRAKELEGFLE